MKTIQVKLVDNVGNVNVLKTFSTFEEAMEYAKKEILAFDGDFFKGDAKGLELYIESEDETYFYQILYSLNELREEIWNAENQKVVEI